MIGRCAKTQTISLAECLSLLDGVPYDINFSQNFSVIHVGGRVLADITVLEITMAILNPPSVSVPLPAPYPSFEEQDRSRRFWAGVEKQQKEDQKRKEKWRKKHPKPKSKKEAWRNFKHAAEKLGV